MKNILTKYFTFFLLLISISIFSQKKWNVRYYHQMVGNEAVLYADNEEFMPISTRFKFKLENMTANVPLETLVVVPPQTKKMEIARIKKDNLYQKNAFSYEMLINFGDVSQEKYDQDFIYWLPYATGKTQLIFQGYDGKLSHKNIMALDFNLKTGEEIFAARGGIVADVVTNNTRNCPDISCAKFNNYVLILHSDGTFAEYAHLKFGGSHLKKGQIIAQGDRIGSSGNTGYSTGPHLHFSVFINRIDGNRDHKKTLFRTSESPATFLEEKKNYTRNY